MEYITMDSHLDYSTDGTTYKELYGLNSDPDMGGEPNKVDVSNMRDRMERSINGLKKMDSLSFEFFYNKDATARNDAAPDVEYNAFSMLNELEQAGSPVHWRYCYPDGSFYSWQGTPTVYMKGGKVGEARQFTLSISAETALVYSEGTAAEGTQTTEEGT